jgi:hypothetical protein
MNCVGGLYAVPGAQRGEGDRDLSGEGNEFHRRGGEQCALVGCDEKAVPATNGNDQQLSQKKVAYQHRMACRTEVSKECLRGCCEGRVSFEGVDSNHGVEVEAHLTIRLVGPGGAFRLQPSFPAAIFGIEVFGAAEEAEDQVPAFVGGELAGFGGDGRVGGCCHLAVDSTPATLAIRMGKVEELPRGLRRMVGGRVPGAEAPCFPVAGDARETQC